MIDRLRIARRHALALGAAMIATAAPATLAPGQDKHLHRLGRRFLAEHGPDAAWALFRSERARLAAVDVGGRAALREACGADHRAGRTATVSGLRLARIEAARAVRAVLPA